MKSILKYFMFLLLFGLLASYKNKNNGSHFESVSEAQIENLKFEAKSWKPQANDTVYHGIKVHTIHKYLTVRNSIDFKDDGVTVKDVDYSFRTDFCNLSQKDDYPGFNNGWVPEYPYNQNTMQNAFSYWMIKDNKRWIPFYHFNLTNVGADLIKRFQPEYKSSNEYALNETKIDDYTYNPYYAVLGSHKVYFRRSGHPSYCRWQTTIGNHRIQQTCTRFNLGTFRNWTSEQQIAFMNTNIKLHVTGVELRGTRPEVP